ncbi:hypothetical protein [Microcoleus sp.]
MPNAQCPVWPMSNAQNDLISRSVRQSEVGGCCPNLSELPTPTARSRMV